MGVDGFSIANTGLNINKTSSAMSSEAEALARLGNDVQIRDVDGVTKKAKTARMKNGYNTVCRLINCREKSPMILGSPHKAGRKNTPVKQLSTTAAGLKLIDV